MPSPKVWLDPVNHGDTESVPGSIKINLLHLYYCSDSKMKRILYSNFTLKRKLFLVSLFGSLNYCYFSLINRGSKNGVQVRPVTCDGFWKNTSPLIQCTPFEHLLYAQRPRGGSWRPHESLWRSEGNSETQAMTRSSQWQAAVSVESIGQPWGFQDGFPEEPT